MRNVLVIGYGNSLRSDDCVGLYAVREVQKKVSKTNVEFLELPQLQPELAERISHSDLTVFIDAATGGISGEINYEPLIPAHKNTSISHATDPESLLGAARELYGHAPTALLATVSGECFGYGTTLSPEVESSMKGVAQRVTDIIEEFLGETRE